MGRYLVTGAGGFVGSAIVRRLRAQGDSVVALVRKEHPDLLRLGCNVIRHDLSTPDPIPTEALDGTDGIFHTAAHVKMWGKREVFFATNVHGTQKLLLAAIEQGVGRLVFTSSPSVVANGKDLRGVDETQPYPKHFEAYYPETKALAEQSVLAANSARLFTCALRPHLIFGPNDPNLTTTVLSRAKTGSLRQIGSGNNIVDFTFIEDCVTAHLLAMNALQSTPSSRGKAYFISQGDPFPLWQWVNEVLALHHLPPITRKVPYRLAILVAYLAEFFSRNFPTLGEPRFTTFLVNEMATDHYFNITRAKEELGFVPSCSVKDALLKSFRGEPSQVRDSGTRLGH